MSNISKSVDPIKEVSSGTDKIMNDLCALFNDVSSIDTKSIIESLGGGSISSFSSSLASALEPSVKKGPIE